MTNLDNVLKSSGITLLTKVHVVKAVVFLAVMYRCDSWNTKKVECQRIDAWIMVLEKTADSPLHYKENKPVNSKGNKPSIFIGRTDADAEVPILWPPDAKSQLLRKEPDAGKDWGQEERGWQRMKWLGGIIESMDMSQSKFWETVKDRGALCAAIHEVTKNQIQLSDWTLTTNA